MSTVFATISGSDKSNIFHQLVQLLRKQSKTCTVIESSLGGLIQANIMAQPGASRVYYGGSIAYNTAKSKPFLLNDPNLHTALLSYRNGSSKDLYIKSKFQSTAEIAREFCRSIPSIDYVLVEGGATGPTFSPPDLHAGFCVLSIAGRKRKRNAVSAPENNTADEDEVFVIRQELVTSTHSDRVSNMQLFADAAASLLYETVLADSAGEADTAKAASHDSSCAGPLVCSCTGLNPSHPSAADHDASGNRTRLNRATSLRGEEQQLRELQSAQSARYLILREGKALFRAVAVATPLSEQESSSPRGHRRLAYWTRSDLDSFASISHDLFHLETSFLGFASADNGQDGNPVFAVDVLDKLTPEDDLTGTRRAALLEGLADANPGTTLDSTTFQPGRTDSVAWEDIRTQLPFLDPEQADTEVLLYGTALAQWQRRSLFCSSCGSPTVLVEGGTSRSCTGSSGLRCLTPRSWPRQDPSMIVAVSSHDGERILLARSPRHPPKVHTALAGFVEAGETMEAAGQGSFGRNRH
jgi:NADH pyrophosphatase NudC (nudix superfamily)